MTSVLNGCTVLSLGSQGISHIVAASRHSNKKLFSLEPVLSVVCLCVVTVTSLERL